MRSVAKRFLFGEATATEGDICSVTTLDGVAVVVHESERSCNDQRTVFANANGHVGWLGRLAHHQRRSMMVALA